MSAQVPWYVLDAAGQAHYEAQPVKAQGANGPMEWDALPGKAREVLCSQVEHIVTTVAWFYKEEA